MASPKKLTYRAQRNTALRTGIWRAGEERDIDPADFAAQIERGLIVPVPSAKAPRKPRTRKPAAPTLGGDSVGSAIIDDPVTDPSPNTGNASE